MIERLVHGGEGLTRVEGKVGLVRDVLPGELVRIEVSGDRPKHFLGRLIEVLQASPLRVRPNCSHFGTCGGCDWQHITYSHQLEQKKQILLEDLSRLGKTTIDPALINMIPSKPWNYRTRIQVHTDSAGVSGFKARSSSRIVPVQNCPVSSPALNAVLSSGSTDAPAGGALAAGIAAVTAAGTEVPSETPLKLPDRRTGRVTFVECDHGVVHSLCSGLGRFGRVNSVSNRLKSDYDACRATCTVSGIPIAFDPRGFFQANQNALEALASVLGRIATEIRPGSLLDLYAGAGLLAALLCAAAGEDEKSNEFAASGQWHPHVLCVEADRNSSRFIRENVEKAGVGGAAVSVVHDTVERFIRDLGSYRGWRRHCSGPTMLIVDPPRGGLSISVRRWISTERFEWLLYLSCESASLARDLMSLNSTHDVNELTILDFYPQTAHIETLILLRLKENKSIRGHRV